MTALELRGVSKLYGEGPTEVRALSDVDLAVEPGALVAVMGPSGSGKSTLLTIAGSLEDPTSGEVFVDGRALPAMSRGDRARLRRRSIGYVFQDFNLLARLTALENVALPLELDGVSAKNGPGLPAGRPWNGSGWATRPLVSPTTSRAVNASGSRSRGPWSASVISSWPMSPPARSTRSTARGSCAWCEPPASAVWPA
jgi:ABC-type sugar transport system ATPase subunit